MTTISLPKLNQEVVSLSATVAQKEAAKFLFGKNYLKILTAIETLAKSKIVLSPHVRGLLLMLRDAEDDEIIKFQKAAGGKATIKAVQDLAKAKTLDASLKAFKAIKVPKQWQTEGTKVSKTPAKVVAPKPQSGKLDKPIPKSKPAKAPKAAPAEKPNLSVGEQVKDAPSIGTPQIPDLTNKPNADTKFGKIVNQAIAVFGNAGYPLHDHDVVVTKNGGYLIRVYPKITNNPRENLAYGLIVHKDETFSYGIYDLNGLGSTIGSENDKGLRKAVSRVIHIIETNNPTNSNAFQVAFGKGKGMDTHKSETVLIDEISTVKNEKLDKEFDKYTDHLKALGDNLNRNIPGLRYKLLSRGLEFIYGSEEWGTLKFGTTNWLLTPYRRGGKTVNVGETYDEGIVIQGIKDAIEAQKKAAARSKNTTGGVTDNLMLKYKLDMTNALASSGLKLFDETHNAQETDDDNIVWDYMYRMPQTGISLPIQIRYNRRRGYAFRINRAPYNMISPGVAQSITKFINALKATIGSVVKGSSKKYSLLDGRPFTPGTGVLHIQEKKVDIRCTNSAIFLTGNPAAVDELYRAKFDRPVTQLNGAATVNKAAPNNYRILCKGEDIRDQVLMEANLIRKL